VLRQQRHGGRGTGRDGAGQTDERGAGPAQHDRGPSPAHGQTESTGGEQREQSRPRGPQRGQLAARVNSTVRAAVQ
jgi:hypothetical protein